MTTVFTNGCFDLLHPGHVDLLARARALGDRLVVGLNGDASVRALKGRGRPLLSQDQRRQMLLALRSVDEVVVFDELTPERLIERLAPDVLVKGGDWQPDQIAGAASVRARGGQVVVLPLVDGLSTTALLERGGGPAAGAAARVRVEETAVADLAASVGDHQDTVAAFRAAALPLVQRMGARIADRLAAGGKLLVAGNGGSAADAQHLAAELVVRYQRDRRALGGIALTTDSSVLTAHGNDLGFRDVFARQVRALARAGDVLVAISTSGRSPNVLAACAAARELGCDVLGLTGASGGELAALCDDALCVPSTVTARIQEVHELVIHLWCEQLDGRFAT